MANVKISALPAASAVAALTDLLPTVQDALGTPATKKLTYQQLYDALSLLATHGGLAAANTVPVIQSGVAKETSLTDLAVYILSQNVWSNENRVIRRVIFRTGATAVDLGEVASTSGTGSAAAHAVSSSNPQGVTYTTGAVNGNIFGWTSTAHHVTAVPIKLEYLVSAPETTAVRYLIGLANNSIGSIGGSDTPGTAFQCALLRWSTNIPDANLQFITGNASAQTVTDLNIAKPAGMFRLGMEFSASGATVDVYINGVLGASISSATMPSTSTALQMTGGATTLAAAAKVTRMYEMLASADY